ncbi:Sperm associated antigen 1 [Nowakowskiella sp. JEL0407]|nr:Sperm associated antigen 1 [Nowakowskiella sp. JEL0407]
MESVALSKILGGDSNNDSFYNVDDLDYAFVAKCTDVEYLEKLLDVLRSGKEGLYPELEEAFENRINVLQPNNTITKRKPAQTTSQQPTIAVEVENWIGCMKNKETNNESIFLAETERIKGNEEFKAGDLNEAIYYYTKSIGIYPSAAAYCNRSLAFLKQKNWKACEEDATITIEKVDTNSVADASLLYKAYIRRGTARLKINLESEALHDFISAKRYLPADVSEENVNNLIDQAQLACAKSSSLRNTQDLSNLGVAKAAEESTSLNALTPTNTEIGNITKQPGTRRRMLIEEIDESGDVRNSKVAQNLVCIITKFKHRFKEILNPVDSKSPAYNERIPIILGDTLPHDNSFRNPELNNERGSSEVDNLLNPKNDNSIHEETSTLENRSNSVYFTGRLTFILTIVGILLFIVANTCVIIFTRPQTNSNSGSTQPTASAKSKSLPSPYPDTRTITRGTLLNPVISLKQSNYAVATFNIASMQLGDNQGNYQVLDPSRNFAYFFNVHGTVDDKSDSLNSKCHNVPACQVTFGATNTWYSIGSLTSQTSLIDSNDATKGLKLTYELSLDNRKASITINCLTNTTIYKAISVSEVSSLQYEFVMYHQAGCPVDVS